VSGGEYPVAVGGDADGNDLVPVPVDDGHHAARRDTGDLVFGTASTENDGDPGLALLGRHTSCPRVGCGWKNDLRTGSTRCRAPGARPRRGPADPPGRWRSVP